MTRDMAFFVATALLAAFTSFLTTKVVTGVKHPKFSDFFYSWIISFMLLNIGGFLGIILR